MKHAIRSACLVTALLMAATAAPPAEAASRKGDYFDGVEAHSAGDYATAVEQWTPLAEAGDARAQYALGFLYQFGQGVERDYAQALDYFRRAARQNDPDAQYALGMLYEQGLGTDRRDPREALQWYRRAADSGLNANAEFATARMYLKAQGTARNIEAAWGYFKSAAAKDHPAAQYALAALYEVGAAVPEDLAQALYWYGQAAKADAEALRQFDPSYNPVMALQAVKERIRPESLKRAEEFFAKGHDAALAAAPSPDQRGPVKSDGEVLREMNERGKAPQAPQPPPAEDPILNPYKKPKAEPEKP